MRIAIAADDDNLLASTVSSHFGRCPFYIIVDVDDDEVKDVQSVVNPFFESHQPGQVPEFIRNQNVDVMVSGGMGRRAISLFDQHGISVATGAMGTVEDALTGYLDGNLRDSGPCRKSGSHKHEGGSW